jgi:pSer/pThr/pTyr-binding forkhead associated (FHA) protein
MPYLIRKTGDPHEELSTEAIEVKTPSFWLGRLSKCDCVLEHPGVSRLHATLRLEDGKAYLCDKTSRNGEQQLRDGDLIQICDTYLIYRESLPNVPASPEIFSRKPEEPSTPPSTLDYKKREAAET